MTWRYHGLLIAALPAPLGRVVMLNHLAEYVRLADGQLVEIGGEEPSQPRGKHAPWAFSSIEFRLENQLPVWRYEVEGIVLEKRLVLLHGQNTVHVTYRLLSDQDIVASGTAALDAFPRARTARERSVAATITNCAPHGDRYEIVAGTTARACGCICVETARAFTLRRRQQARDLLSKRCRTRLRIARLALESGLIFSVDLPRQTSDADRVPPNRGTRCWH